MLTKKLELNSVTGKLITLSEYFLVKKFMYVVAEISNDLT